MSGGLRRTTIGFKGGQVLAVKLTNEELKELRAALGGDGWHEVKTEESTAAVDLGQVIFLNVESDEHRVGFS
jgi:hypothetical protein